MTYVWNFSDGGVAYGAQPTHTFPGSGGYTGHLVVSDAAGNTSAVDFSVNITNLPPVVNAGPDTTAAWGTPVSFNGSATDPGSADQATLTYSWAFGDGSPSASGGPSTTHSYAAPGVYTATLTSCDAYGLCASSTRTIHIRLRNVTLGYLGSSAATFGSPAGYRASLTDEFGNAVPGRLVSFTLGSEPTVSAASDSSGTAQATQTVTLGAGSYTVSATFPGDTLYTPAAPSSAAFSVSRQATHLSYTGPLSACRTRRSVSRRR